MQRSVSFLDPTLANVFGSRFDSDLVDLDDRDDIEGLAETVVYDLMLRGRTAHNILHTLEHVRANWGGEVLEEFTDASDVNWAFDAETENDLRFIVATMIDTARRRSVSVKAAE